MTYYRCLSRTKTSRGTGMESARVYSCEYRASNMWIRANPYITHYFSYGIRTGFFTGVAWKLPLLTEECFTYMRKFKNIENVCRFYELSLKHQNIDALYDMSNYIREHLSELSEGNHLVQLSLKAFCEIIKSDEVNVEIEDVICATAMSLIENEQSDEDITKCLKLIRYEHLTSDFVFDITMSQPIMKNEPQKSYLKNGLKYLWNKDGIHPEKTARFWGPRQRLVYVNNKKNDL